jgi:hypothetical protein
MSKVNCLYCIESDTRILQGKQRRVQLEYANIIAREADSLPTDKQVEVLDFIEFLKAKQSRAEQTFFRSLNVDTSRFKFDRDEANAR